MSNGPKRAKTHSQVERTLVVSKGVREKIEEYCAGMQSVYAGVQDILFANYASLIAKVASDNTMTAADRKEQSDSIKNVTQEYTTKHTKINPNLVCYVVKDVFDLLKEYWYDKKRKIKKQAFDDYVKGIVKDEVVVVFANDNPRLNLGSPDRGWYWQPVTLDCSIDKDSIHTFNTEKGQDTSIVSQHRDSTHLVIGEDGQYHLRIVMSRDVPLAYPEGNILAIDVGLNRFFTAVVRDNVNRKMHTHYCADSSLLATYKNAVDAGNEAAINRAIVEIRSRMLAELDTLIKKYKIKYVVLENLREGLEKSESAWSACYPWVETQEIIADYCADKGVYVIFINANGTSKDYAHGDDEIERDSTDHTIGMCKKSKEKVDADKNAAYNILGRGVIKIFRKFHLTPDQDSDLERYADSLGYKINALNFSQAKAIVSYCKSQFKLSILNI